MSKMLMLIWGFIFAISTFAYAQEKYSVSGEVKFPKRKGVILVWLKNQEEYKKTIGEPASPTRNLMIKPSPQQLKAKKVTFKFVDVPNGFYAIECIQDLNKNGKMDYKEDCSFGMKCPTEPSGFSGTRLWEPGQWSDIKFEVDKDISGIEIEMSY
jgi:uncharacterized protein (DUF2141 family)